LSFVTILAGARWTIAFKRGKRVLATCDLLRLLAQGILSRTEKVGTGSVAKALDKLPGRPMIESPHGENVLLPVYCDAIRVLLEEASGC